MDINEYMDYFQVEGDAVYIRQDFIHRIKEIPSDDFLRLMRVVFKTDDARTIQKMIDSFGTGKPVRVSARAKNKERIPSDLRWNVWERDNFTCQKCGSRQYLSIDHIIPEIKGGELTMDNCQTLCKSCNSRKGAR